MADMKRVEDFNEELTSEEVPEEEALPQQTQLPEAEAAEEEFPLTDREPEEPVSYEEIARRDVAELKEIFPELFMLTSITQLENPMRYAALRDLGLSPKEAYLATSSRPAKKYDGKSHLRGSVPIGAFGSGASMSTGELQAARELFGDLSDTEIQKLYKRVLK